MGCNPKKNNKVDQFRLDDHTNLGSRVPHGFLLITHHGGQFGGPWWTMVDSKCGKLNMFGDFFGGFPEQWIPKTMLIFVGFKFSRRKWSNLRLVWGYLHFRKLPSSCNDTEFHQIMALQMLGEWDDLFVSEKFSQPKLQHDGHVHFQDQGLLKNDAFS